jgi:hypothetical protein
MHGAIPPLPQYVFMAWCLVKHRDNFAFFYRAGSLKTVASELAKYNLDLVAAQEVRWVEGGS